MRRARGGEIVENIQFFYFVTQNGKTDSDSIRTIIQLTFFDKDTQHYSTESTSDASMKYVIAILAVFLFVPFSFASQKNASLSPSSVEWGLCPSHVKADGDLQCAIIQQPLDHDKPDGEQIDVLLMRALGKSEKKKSQIWFLNGGPGDSLDTFSYLMDMWSVTHPDYDYYAMEHRGTGVSAYLSCNDEPASPQCLEELEREWGEGLGLFNTTQASHDLASAMKLVGSDSKRFLYGVSYGTYFVQRFISIYGSMLQGAILDSAVPAVKDENGLYPIDKYDHNFNALALKIATLCDNDATCRSKMTTFGADTKAVMQKAFEKIDNGDICEPLKGLVTRQSLRNMSAELVGDYWGRQLYPALLYRINRCSPKDIEVLSNLFQEDDEPETEDEILSFSQNLNTNIVVNELIGGKSLAQVKAETKTYFAATDETVEHYQSLEKTKWPQYPTDQYTHKWAETDVPLLIINGDLDPATPLAYAQQVKGHFKGRHQYLITLPGTPHGALFLSLMKDVPLDDADTCGSRLLFSFMDDVTKQPDTSCISNMIPPDFSGSSEEAKTAAKRFFNSESVWD